MDTDEPRSLPPERPRKRPTSFVRQLAMATELPFILVGGVLIAGGLGYLLDARLHTSPLFMIVLGLLGFAAGIREILRRLSQEEKKNDAE